MGTLTYNHMVVGIAGPELIDQVFRALADATRRDIVMRTLQDEYSVSTLASHYPMSFAAVQKHVAVLEDAQLVTKRRRGREQLVSGNVGTIRATRDALDQLEQLWRDRIDRFADVLADDHASGGRSGRPSDQPEHRDEGDTP